MIRSRRGKNLLMRMQVRLRNGRNDWRDSYVTERIERGRAVCHLVQTSVARSEAGADFHQGFA
jgi:hypothetical protein